MDMFVSTKERASKSFKRLTKAKISTPIAQSTTLDLPKKIIKAIYDYKAKGPHEISFKQGDFFHVTGRENDLEWYEASNPLTKQKGVVPVSYFQVVDKSEKSLTAERPNSSSTSSTLTSELDSGFSDISLHGQQFKKKHQIYGVVMYDFKAERADELDAQAGEAIVVIAQSNHEWFVAKPIGRLGGPGLIPVSFVQVRDAFTGELIEQQPTFDIPAVDDWKKTTQLYEANSISLGSFESKHLHQDHRISDSSTESRLLNEIVNFASIDSYILEGDQYWFIVYARVSSDCHRILYRLYEDFYDFQIALLQQFPIEAGIADKDRILPFMPSPLTHVDEKATADRQVDLNRYCQELLKLPSYISSSDLVQKQLFGIHEGDIELDYDPRITDPNTTTTATTTTTINNAATDLVIEPVIEPTVVAELQQIKIKIVYKDDIFAIKIPSDCSLYYLKSKVYERIQSTVKLEYKNELTNKNQPLETELDMEEAFEIAIQKGKLTVIALT